MQKVSELVSKNIGDTLTNMRTWKNVMYNVLENGLVGNGTTDDTAALQTLINTAIEAGRRAIFFPHTPTGGQYYVTSLINANQVDFLGDNCSFIGGYAGTIENMGGTAELKAETVTGLYNAKYNGLALDGTTDDYPALDALLTTIGSDKATIQFPPGVAKLSSDITIPSNVTLWFLRGAMLAPDSGVTVTINGEFDAGTYQIFAGDGTIVRGSDNFNSVSLRPEWWGAIADGVEDCRPAVVALIDFIGTSKPGIMRLSSGVYGISTTSIVVDCKLSIIGEGELATTIMALSFANDNSIFDYQGTTGARLDGITLQGFTIRSDNQNPRGFTMAWVIKSTFDRVRFYYLKRGLYLTTCFSNTFKDLSTYQVSGEVVTLKTQCNNLAFIRCVLGGGSGVVANESMSQIGFYSCNFEACSTYGIAIIPGSGLKVQNVEIRNCYFEKNPGTAIYVGAFSGTVEEISIENNYFTVEGTVQFPILLRDVTGFIIRNNVAQNYTGYLINRNGTAANGIVENNKYTMTDLTSSGQVFNALDIEVKNNSTGRKVLFGTAAPATGTWALGDVVNNKAPSAGGNIGWVCTTAGSPGTWKTFGTIAS